MKPPRFAAAIQGVVRALALYVIPALLAGLALEFLVPPVGNGFVGWVARIGHDDSLVALAALFLLFSMLAHYWRFHVPGGRHASALPFHWVPDERLPERLRSWARLARAYERLTSGGARRRLERLGPEALGAFDLLLDAAASAIAAGDLDAAAIAVRAAGVSAVPSSVAWKRGAGVVIAVAATATMAFVLREKVVGSYQVLSASMLPTLEPADRIAADKLAYGVRGLPARGDVILFRSAAVALGNVPGLPDILVKRVVGLPGDRIEMDGESPSSTAGRCLPVTPGCISTWSPTARATPCRAACASSSWGTTRT
jgi:hypothetical protein